MSRYAGHRASARRRPGVNTTELLEEVRRRAEAKARRERPELFDDEDCSECDKSELEKHEERMARK